MNRDWARFLYLERQFCSVCRGLGRPGVRIADVRRRLEVGDARFKRERGAAARRHMLAEHPTLAARVR